MQPIISLWQCATCHAPDYPWYMTHNRWHSIDAHFHDGAGRALQSVRPMRVAKNSLMLVCNLSAVWLLQTNDQKLVMICWCSFSIWNREHVVIICPIKAANTSIMYNHKRINFDLPDLHDLKLSMLRWPTFCHGCIHIMQLLDLA
jgi:hypothetical protein